MGASVAPPAKVFHVRKVRPGPTDVTPAGTPVTEVIAGVLPGERVATANSGVLRSELLGIAASLLSLGALDFGLVVGSSVVMVENCVRHIAHGDLKGRSKREVVRNAAVEVHKPTQFGELIILIVYRPILTLEGVEGKLFRWP
jgi:hypothetical protein